MKQGFDPVALAVISSRFEGVVRHEKLPAQTGPGWSTSRETSRAASSAGTTRLTWAESLPIRAGVGLT
jgi:hypothetical protein